MNSKKKENSFLTTDNVRMGVTVSKQSQIMAEKKKLLSDKNHRLSIINPVYALMGRSTVDMTMEQRSCLSMVRQLASDGINDSMVLQALSEVPRHIFVASDLRSRAYVDTALPIGEQQTISKPSTVARMIQAMRMKLGPKRMQKVLEIGTGCGYQAAVLAKIADEVYSIERIRSLHELSRKNLRKLRIANLRLQYGDGMLGLPKEAPFDGIIVAAAGLSVPETLLEQLSIGGRLIAPIGSQQQTLQLICRVTKNRWEKQVLDSCFFVPLLHGTV